MRNHYNNKPAWKNEGKNVFLFYRGTWEMAPRALGAPYGSIAWIGHFDCTRSTKFIQNYGYEEHIKTIVSPAHINEGEFTRL